MKAIVRLPERARSTDNSLPLQVLGWILGHVLPRASPDYDRYLPQVSYWLIEVNAAGQATREIGFNDQDTPVLFAPTDRNYGLWTDSDRVFTLDQLDTTEDFPFDETWNALRSKHVDLS